MASCDGACSFPFCKKHDENLNIDLYRFGARMEARWPPKMTFAKSENRTYSFMCLRPSSRVRHGHLVTRMQDSVMQEPRIAVTLVPVTKDGKDEFHNVQKSARKCPMERLVIPTNKKGLKHDLVNESSPVRDEVDENGEPKLRRSARLENKKFR